MPCLLVLLALLVPRVALVLMWLSGYTAHAFATAIWPLLGFFVMPYTTCAYAIAMNSGGIRGWTLLLLIIGVVLDLGGHGASQRHVVYVRQRRGWQ